MDTLTEPNFSKVALITIDTQVDTLDGEPFEVPGTTAVLPRIATLLEAFRNARAPIVYIVRIYRRDAANVDLCRRSLIVQGVPLLLQDSPGCALAPPLRLHPELGLRSNELLRGEIQRVRQTEVIVYKPR